MYNWQVTFIWDTPRLYYNHNVLETIKLMLLRPALTIGVADTGRQGEHGGPPHHPDQVHQVIMVYHECSKCVTN